MAKLQVSIDDELLKKIDKYSETMYMSRSGFISYAAAQVINSNAVMVAITDISLAMKKIADTGVISDDERQQLEDFERVIKMITSSK